jgi:peptidyl-prolyl cis-trans isomerase SurA
MGLVFFSPAGFCAAPEMPASIQLNKIAAVVNGEGITLHELRRIVGPELMRRGIQPGTPGTERAVNNLMEQALNHMIDTILLRQEATRLHITASDADVDNELNMLVQRNQTTLESFEAGLAAQGSSLEAMRAQIRNNILSQRIVNLMIARKVVVTKEGVARYYDEHSHEFMADRSVDLSLIIFSPSADAEAAAGSIRNGSKTFEAVAREYSIGPQPDQGGKLGFVPWKDLIPPVQIAASGLQAGEVSPLFSIESYKALLCFNGSTPGRQMTLEEATPEIERILREPLLQARFEEYTQQLRSKAVIDIRI